MVFSRRSGWPTDGNPLSRAIAARRGAATPAIDLTHSNPTTASLSYPTDAILAAFSDACARALVYEPNPRGLPHAREAVARELSRSRGTPVPPDAILLTASTSEAYSFLFKLLCDPGDAIHVPRPSYPLLDVLAKSDAVELTPYPLRYDGEWHLDAARLRESITPHSRAIVTINPNNPTGSYVKAWERKELLALGLPVISDEVFFEFPAEAGSQSSVSFVNADTGLVFVLGGLSKLVGLPQLKLGWIVALEEGRPAHVALDRLEHIADAFLSVSATTQHAAARLLETCAPVRDAILGRARANLAALRDAIGTASNMNLLHFEGGWNAVLRVPCTRTDEEWALRLLADDDVLVHPGYFYDFETDGHLVVSLLVPEPGFATGIARIVARVQADG